MNRWRSPLRNLPPVVRGLLIANGLLFIFQNFFGSWVEFTFGLVPSKVLFSFHLWQLFTYMFFHGSFFHLLFNSFTLWMFGKELESAWGSREFLKFYFICGLGAGILNTCFEPFSLVPIIGSSGAIYGLLAAFAIVFPDSMIYLYGVFPMRSKHFVLLLGAIEFFASFHGAPTLIARFAHLGGMLTGAFYLKSYEFRSFLNHLFMRFLDFFIVTNRPKKTKRPENKKEDLVKEVDRILEKVLVHGAESLTEKEREIMRRYSSMKH